MNKLLNIVLFAAWLVPISYQAFAAPRLPQAVDDAVANEGIETRTVRLRIRGMRSDACPVLVKAALVKLPGVKAVSANVEQRTATVQYDPAETSAEEIQNTIKTETGFDAEILAD